ncbi:MAG TPA: hypothetical protein PKY77_11480 [Phycisphaerae bacterium]|nr:hypothetical protein [Phycisphaerae bacterium]HRY70342.1 hypothetical protein [Phycisphaerae bacterium]HSA28059.1 hypothetical protein [Phycisphaerae bacterium]
MKCKKCGYRLWQLPTRRCPECGADFRPSNYEFVPNSVEFSCPHCRQPYYGTGPKGHLEPIAFNCVTCGRPVTMDEMILSPAPGTSETQTEVFRLPWLDRKERGWLRAWLATARSAMLSPAQMMKGVPVESSGWEAFGFAFLNTLPPMIMAVLPIAAVMLVMTLATPQSAIPIFVPVAVAVEFAVIGVVCLVGTVVWAVATHLLLRLTGQTAGPLLRTQQAIYYSSGANLISAIPCLGYYVGWIWWIVSAILAVKEGQRVHGGRAVFTVLGPLVACALLFAGLAAAMIGLANVRTSSTPPAATPLTQAMADTRKVTQAVIRYIRRHNGRGPDHAILLVTQGDLLASDFISSDSATTLGKTPLAGTTLDYFNFARPNERTQLASRAVANLPTGTVAHRLGDYVFTCKGMNPSISDNRLWVVVQIVDPVANAGQPPRSHLICGMADGGTQMTPVAHFLADLKTQNGVRAEHGLPPLPDLRTITHTQPATSAPAEASE